MMRDFTFIDDIVEGVVRVIGRVPQGDFPYEIFNIGNHSPVRLMDFIYEIEKACGREAEKIMLPMQAGDVPVTYADTAKLEARGRVQAPRRRSPSAFRSLSSGSSGGRPNPRRARTPKSIKKG